MKKVIVVTGMLCVLLLGTALGKTATPKVLPVLSRTLVNSRFVYVTSYDGDQFSQNILQEDRVAISNVQDAIQKWGKLTLVYKVADADIVMVVQARASEDVLAVYDAHMWPGNYLWRVMGRGGLQKGETPLVTDFQKAWDLMAK